MTAVPSTAAEQRPPLCGKEIRRRKRLLRHRARLCEAWNQVFPQHDFATGRMREQHHIVTSDDPGWVEAAREYHAARIGRHAVVEMGLERLTLLRRLLADDVSLDHAWRELNGTSARPTPQTTIEAIIHCVRERGLAALKEAANLERLQRCDDGAKVQINARIPRVIEKKAPSYDP
jgi:hypothetical protein